MILHNLNIIYYFSNIGISGISNPNSLRKTIKSFKIYILYYIANEKIIK